MLRLTRKRNTGIVTFGVPLTSRTGARDWDVVVSDFNLMLASLYNQSEPNFRIIVAYTDMPDVTIRADDRLNFIHVPQKTPPSDHTERNADRGLRLSKISKAHASAGGGYLMEVDADDRVSSRLVEYVARRKNPNGYIVEHGYIFDRSSGLIATLPLNGVDGTRFDQLCGTCAALFFTPRDMKRGLSEVQSRIARIKRRGHHFVRDALIEENRPAEPFPFPAAVYVLNTGNNNSQRSDRNDGGQKATFYSQLLSHVKEQGQPLNPEIDKEFCLTKSYI